MSATQLKAWLEKFGITKEGDLYLAPFVAESVKSRDDVMRVTISTKSQDRHGDILEPSGCVMENFMQNPVVLWAHHYDQLPIARAKNLEPRRNRIEAELEFADTEFAREVRRLYEDGFLRAWSVGFIPLEWDVIESEEKKFQGYHVKRWELLEFSAVPVPANAQALTNAILKGAVKTPELRRCLQTVLNCQTEGVQEKEPPEPKSGESKPEEMHTEKPGWEETDDYWRIRVRDPNDFIDGTERTVTIKRDKPRVMCVMGKLKDGDGTMRVQNVMFPKADGWTKEKAKAWLDDHDDLMKSYSMDNAEVTQLQLEEMGGAIAGLRDVVNQIRLDVQAIMERSESEAALPVAEEPDTGRREKVGAEELQGIMQRLIVENLGHRLSAVIAEMVPAMIAKELRKRQGRLD